nr:unnamed protein product [Callosobruchus analis]CAI5839250.1 unnamed protein product [Callosobruchus analis]
MTKRSTLKDF